MSFVEKKQTVLEKRIRKGIEYFRGIKPSKFNVSHFTHFKFFLDLIEKHLNGKKDVVEVAQEVFKEEIKREGD